MKDWHIRHKIFHQVFQDMDLGDDLSKEKIILEEDDESIVRRALEYPVNQTRELYYPGKSYCVAIIYAKLLEKNFGEDFYTCLDDDLLLYENDPYFCKYSSKKEVYDQIIKDFNWDLIDSPEKATDNFQRTTQYFYKEFLLHETTKHFAPPK